MQTPLSVKIESTPAQFYNISLGNGLVTNLIHHIPADLHHHRMVIVTDNTVKKHYEKHVIKALSALNQDIVTVSFPAGEKSKTAVIKSKIESTLFKHAMGRDTCIIALGGGVVGDLAGFVAATYMRGIPYIHMPTTLIALLDSSIGGKTAINAREGKNLIGAFWHPRAVIADLDFLKTLPKNQQINGWIEALKIFLTSDGNAFRRFTDEEIGSLAFIRKAIELKSQVVARDPHDKNARATLNFGHTIGHALERLSDYQLPHGIAVGYGILVESAIALKRELLAPQEYAAIVSALSFLGIDGKALNKYASAAIIKATSQDKKTLKQQAHYVLLNGIGRVLQSQGQYTHPIDPDEVARSIDFVIRGESHGRK